MEGPVGAAGAATAGLPAAGAAGASLCPSTTMGVPQLLQRILTLRPRTLSSAMVYLAPHAWQLTFIDRYLALNLQNFRDTGKLWVNLREPGRPRSFRRIGSPRRTVRRTPDISCVSRP